MPGGELSTSACDGHVVVALRRELDVTGAAEAILLAAVCGAHCTPWEGGGIAYWHRVTAAGVRAGPQSSVPGRTRR